MPIKDSQGNYTGQEWRVCGFLLQLHVNETSKIGLSIEHAQHSYCQWIWFRPWTTLQAVYIWRSLAVATMVPSTTAADQALVTFKVKKPRCASPKPTTAVEEPKKEQAKTQISAPSTKNSVNSDKPPARATAPKPTKKNTVTITSWGQVCFK